MKLCCIITTVFNSIHTYIHTYIHRRKEGRDWTLKLKFASTVRHQSVTHACMHAQIKVYLRAFVAETDLHTHCSSAPGTQYTDHESVKFQTCTGVRVVHVTIVHVLGWLVKPSIMATNMLVCPYTHMCSMH